jgi:hypothetical protein
MKSLGSVSSNAVHDLGLIFASGLDWCINDVEVTFYRQIIFGGFGWKLKTVNLPAPNTYQRAHPGLR